LLGAIPSSGAVSTATAPQPAGLAPVGAPSGAADPAGLPALPGAEGDPVSAERTEPGAGTLESVVNTSAQPSAGPDVPATAVPVHTTPAPAVQPGAAPAPAAKPQPAAPPPPASQLAAEIAPLRSRDGEHTLTVHLHPVDLGPITVTAQVRGQDIQLNLGGATESGREALRAALPDLRRELEQAGFSSCLFNTGTGGREDNRPAWLRQNPEARDEVSGPTATPLPATAATAGRSRTTGVLDLHA
ncbi:MAG: flagellar hook-length control protein FliK, partial [Labedaea sp.]